MSQSGLVALRRAEDTGHRALNDSIREAKVETVLKQFDSSAKPKNNDERHIFT
jgi:hypothetical protein